MSAASPEGDLAIHTHRLTKAFGQRKVVHGLDLAVPYGSVFGFLGPNGSGKTTTIRMLLGLAAPTSGSITVLGRPMPSAALEVLPGVGALVEGPAFYPFLSGRANLMRLDAANRRADPATRARRVDRALDTVGLGRAARLAVHAYSLGMKQRLGIANALAVRHQLLVLDEPTNGLDPQGTREVRSLIASLAGQGTTVFVSSHLLGEIEQMCTHAAVMSAGNRVAQGTLAELRSGGAGRVRVNTPDGPAARAVLAGLGLAPEDGAGAGTLAEGGDDAVVRAPLAAGAPEPERIVAALVDAGVRVRGFAVERPSLEERFVELTGEGFDVAQ
ncbi:ABC transporter ATP-binding protein [Zafaria cholistanensis]|uniref:ABC transporter ATP-binding protein n=1 Tax=Zafaria cholistanensis TaxID=1682741 RepID=A0A5A7NSL9_9MICC|nr:ABC transporter ATP-binding protein [Zafaria cholistanensis]GER22751.1 ABC transporter ATP-binding protein [Zafaria cholistanensis]